MELPTIRRETAGCFTGHRPERLPGGYAAWDSPYSPLRPRIRRAVEKAAADGYRDFICGMALGADTLAAEEVLGLRGRFGDIRLIAAIPCPEQATRWPAADRARYRRLLGLADIVVTVSPVFTPYAMHLRNRWMVDHASRLIAIFDGSPGGTANTVRLAEKQGLDIVFLSPDAPPIDRVPD